MIKNKIMFCLIASMLSFKLSFPCFAMFDDNEDGGIKAVSVVQLVQQRMIGAEADQDKINGFTSGSKPSRLINFLGSITSLTSYFSPSAKAVIQGAYEIVDFTSKNPKKGMIIGLCLAYHVAAVAAQYNCQCYYDKTPDIGSSYYAVPGMTEAGCQASCDQLCNQIFITYENLPIPFIGWNCTLTP